MQENVSDKKNDFTEPTLSREAAGQEKKTREKRGQQPFWQKKSAGTCPNYCAGVYCVAVRPSSCLSL